ncbi:MAG: LamG domain-containing protein [Prevotellaceae bacterium]|jgi:hypothetical protein|nr:LamG domain-containing protein [Prevotellaceae bacterium]
MKKSLLNIRLSAIALICAGLFFNACKEEEPNVADYRPGNPFITVDATSLALKGDDSIIKLVVDCNREVTVVKTDLANWVTVTQTPSKTGDRITGYSLVVSVNRSNVPKKRNTSFVLESVKKDGETEAATPVTVKIEQLPYMLPEADLLDVVFADNGNANDISPAKNTIYTGRTYVDFAGDTIKEKKPTVSKNDDYGRNVAKFSGPVATEYNNGQRWGTCYYRVDLVDYKDVKSAPNGDSKQIPFTKLGKAIADTAFTIEVLCKWNSDKGALLNDSDGQFRMNTPFSGTQRYSVDEKLKGGAGIVHNGSTNGFSFAAAQIDTCDGQATKQVYAGAPTTVGRFYHIVGAYSFVSKKMTLYVDGVKAGETVLSCGNNIRTAAPTKPEEALAQFLVIGGSPRACDPFNNGGVKINTPANNAAEQLFDGEIAIARVYGKTLTQEEVTVLYNYERP